VKFYLKTKEFTSYELKFKLERAAYFSLFFSGFRE